MDGHDGHRAACRARRRLRRTARFEGGVHPAQEGVQAQPAGVRRSHIGREGAQVFAPLRAVFHGARHCGPARAGVCVLAYLVQRGAGRPGAQGTQHGGKALLFFAAALQHGGIQRALRAGKAQARKVVRRKAEHAAEHHGGHMDVLRGVIHHAQQRKHAPHLRLGQQVFACVRRGSYARALQRGLVLGKIGTAAQQDAEILRPARARAALAVAHGKARGQHAADMPGHHVCVRACVFAR